MKSYAFINRTAIRAALLLALVGGVQVAGAVDKRFDSFMGKVVGNSTTVTFGSGGQALVTSSSGLGTPALGNFGLTQSGTGLTAAGNVSVPLGNTGKSVAAVASVPITRTSFIRGLGTVLGAAAGSPFIAGLMLAAPLIKDWLTDGGLFVDDDGNITRDASCTGGYYTNGKNFCTAVQACQYRVSLSGGNFNGNVSYWGGGSWLCGGTGYLVNYSASVVVNQTLPASLDDIAEYMDKPEAPAIYPELVVQAVQKTGVDPFGGSVPTPSVTGPAAVPGQKIQTSTQVKVHPGTTTEVAPGTTSATQPATKTVTSEAAYNVTYNNNEVNYNTTNITNTVITNNVTGDTETTVEESETEDDAKTEESECEKYPDSLACADLDEPDGEIPKSTFDVSYSIEDTFGSGSCPADLYSTVHGQSMKVWDYQATCSYVVSYVRPVILILASMAALFIIAPGKV
ncbi:MAG: hypothetical protein QM569_04075 [Acidovorax sp.]|uniref:hypothetical protein n=1 Tax=Acidovorax sp. TaxID=1872122 RepID=UPI0039E27D43